MLLHKTLNTGCISLGCSGQDSGSSSRQDALRTSAQADWLSLPCAAQRTVNIYSVDSTRSLSSRI